MSRVLIVNPMAGAGRVGRKLQQIHQTLEAIAGPIELMPTQASKHASTLAAQAVQNGATEVWSLGGDGTHSEVVTGLESCPESNHVSLGILHGGTGGDFSRMLGRGSLKEQARRLVSGTSTLIDLGEVSWKEGDQTRRQVFLNEVSVGMSAAICARVNDGSKRLGGRLSFLFHTLRTLVDFKPHDIRLTADGKSKVFKGVRTTLACNGRWAGGGMMFAPNAHLDDGKLDLVILLDSPVHRAVGLIPSLYDGSFTRSRYAEVLRATSIRIESLTERQHVEADGEVLAMNNVEIAVIPKRLRLLGFHQEKD